MNDRLFLIDCAANDARYNYEQLARSVFEFRPGSLAAGNTNLFDYFASILAAIVSNDDFSIVDESLAVQITGGGNSTSDRDADAEQRAEWDTETRLRWLLERIRQSRSRVTLATSGTTGPAKSITHHVGTLLASVQVSEKHQSDIWALTYQPSRIAAIQVFFQLVCNLNPAIHLYGVSPDAAAERIQAHQVSHISATPTYLKMLTSGGEVYPTVRAVTVGGEVSDQNGLRRLRSAFPNARFRNVYAASEFGTLLHAEGDVFAVPDPLRDAVDIRDNRLWLRHDMVASSLASQLQNGFYDTKDIVEVVSTDPLSFRVIGRESDWINVGGAKVNPHVVEAALLQIAGIRDVRVYGQPNSVCGYFVAAEVVVDPDASVEVRTIRSLLREKLPSAAVPRIIEIVDQLAITEAGKKRRLL